MRRSWLRARRGAARVPGRPALVGDEPTSADRHPTLWLPSAVAALTAHMAASSNAVCSIDAKRASLDFNDSHRSISSAVRCLINWERLRLSAERGGGVQL